MKGLSLFDTAWVAKLKPIAAALVPSSLISWFRGENNFTDQKGNVTGTDAGDQRMGYTTGKVNQSFLCPGDGTSFINLGSAVPLQLQSFTIELWRQRADAADTNGANGYGYFYGWQNGGYGIFEYGSYPDGSLNGCIATGQVGVSNFNQSTDQLPQDTDWHHIAVTWDNVAGVVTYYLDGNPDSGGPQTFGTTGWTFTNLTFPGYSNGGTGVNADFNGNIDELSVWNRVLSDTEIMNIYLSGSAGKPLGT